MKKLLTLLLAALILATCTGCSSIVLNPITPPGTNESTPAPTVEPTVEPTTEPTASPTSVPTAEPTAEPTAIPTAIPTPVPTAVPAASGDGSYVDPDYGAAIIRRVLDAIGPELIARGKEADFKMRSNVSYLLIDPEEVSSLESVPEEDKTRVLIYFDIRSAMGSTIYGNNTVDYDVLREIQYAIIDSGVFDITAEEAEELKSYVYTEKVTAVDEIVGNDYRLRLTITELPTTYSLLVEIRGFVGYSLGDYYTVQRWSSEWDGPITYEECEPD